MDYWFLLNIVVANQISPINEKSYNQSWFLFRMSPPDIVIDILGKVFDFLDFDDLERAAWCWKIFWYLATMDKLFLKFHLESLPTESLKNKNDETRNDWTSLGRPTAKTGYKSVISASSTFNRTDTAKLTKE